jgi:metallophosphoesterase superfamily enzyme
MVIVGSVVLLRRGTAQPVSNDNVVLDGLVLYGQDKARQIPCKITHHLHPPLWITGQLKSPRWGAAGTHTPHSRVQRSAEGGGNSAEFNRQLMRASFLSKRPLLGLFRSHPPALSRAQIRSGPFANLRAAAGMRLAHCSALFAAFGAVATAQKAPILARNSSDDASLVFKILQLADLHISGIPTVGCGSSVPTGMARQDCSEALTYQFVEQLLDVEEPDFIAFTGDNVQVYGPSSHQRAIDAVTKAAEERHIPYGMVFGNHDQEGDFPREKIVEMVSEKNHSYTVSGPETVDGVGNYMLNVTAPAAGAWGGEGDTVFRMYFLDSGAEALTDKYPYVFSEYDWIKQSQIDYYRQLSETGRAERHSSADSVLPAVMFFHIPLVEFAYSEDDCNGDKNEWVHDQGMNLRLLSTLSEMSEVKAAFVGHDHLNEYCCLVDGVQLCYGGGTGFGRSYGNSDFSRRARVIEWTVDSDERHEVRSWKRHYDDVNVVHSEEVLYSEV